MFKKLLSRNKKTAPTSMGLGSRSHKVSALLKNSSETLMNYNPNDWVAIKVTDSTNMVGTAIGSIHDRSVISTRIGTIARLRTVLVHKDRKIHEVNIDSTQFMAIKLRLKTFVVLKNESSLESGDVINLYEVKDGECVGVNALYTIKYVEEIEQQEGLVIVSIAPIS